MGGIRHHDAQTEIERELEEPLHERESGFRWQLLEGEDGVEGVSDADVIVVPRDLGVQQLVTR